jgi:hypothetical protein
MTSYGMVTVIKSGEAWFAQVKRGLQRIDAAMAERGVPDADVGDALTAWSADPEAFADVVHGLVALGVKVEPACMVLAGMTPPTPGIGRDDDR